MGAILVGQARFDAVKHLGWQNALLVELHTCDLRKFVLLDLLVREDTVCLDSQVGLPIRVDFRRQSKLDRLAALQSDFKRFRETLINRGLVVVFRRVDEEEVSDFSARLRDLVHEDGVVVLTEPDRQKSSLKAILELS